MTHVRDVGEQGVLQRLKAFCPPEIIGDDGAVLAVASPNSVVVTTDVLVENVHFSDRTTSPEDIGWRAVAANLSDLAAMGASPLGLTVGLSLRGDISLPWLDRLYQGLSACATAYQTALVGGDVCRSPVVSLAITALGEVAPHQVLRRDRARPGDAIIATGDHGNARGGLELLLNPDLGQNLTQAQRETLIAAHCRPRPRLDVLPPLRSLLGENNCAAMDSSDGLADAIIQICTASQVGAIVEGDRLPIAPVLTQFVDPETAREWALYGGEDFELVLCLPPALAETLVSQLGSKAAIVGTIQGDRSVNLRQGDTLHPLTLAQGFQHF
ncbi:MAG: thiamine-phosphate kinase [Jaaginema sp. PMC 1079.18]|nr:thiamine-phosphate kinase [Jaaginema sp. PMC 1080.18]MEC4852183.1 thiamine-phosphate kinase [Jaaginema sp. PMC 1079.18]MEC4865692.1 thiamine-phosphate kinase [Jaaginema sp. PMC 1078.18]